MMTQVRDAPVFAQHGERLHGVCAVWPLHCLDRLRAGVEQGRLRSLYGAMEALGGKTCLIEAGPNAYFNINTSDDLARAEELAQEM
jgi:molybdopterin-guanine dinucleotide biosynthesis protein A